MESRIYLVVCMLLALTQLTFSEDDILWCNQQQEHSMHAVNGRNISVSFNVADQFRHAQSLVWEKENHTVYEKLNNRSLNFSTDEYSNPGRYKLTQINGTSFDMFIAFTEQNDSGQHIVKIKQGIQSLCTIVILNLTIEGTAPICSALFIRESGTLQMSCQWVQVNEGDRAQLFARNQSVYEYETLGMNFRGEHKLMNKLSAYVAPQDIFNENVLPSECVITNSMHKLKTSRVCTFPTIRTHEIRKDLNQNEVFECSKVTEANFVSWWYTNFDFLLSDSITEGMPVGDDNQAVLLCGEEDGNLTIITVHEIWRVQFQEDQKCNISVSAEGKRSVVNITCTNMSENIGEDVGTSCNRTSNNEGLSPTTYNSHGSNNVALYALAVLSALALTSSLCGCFAKCCQTFFRKRRLKEESDQETANARNNDGADSVHMTALSTQTTQPHRVSELTQSAPSHGPSDENNFCANQEASLPEYDLRDRPPTLPSRRHLVKRDKKCCDISTVKQLTSDDICDTKPVGKSIAGADAFTASNYDCTYCSVDDVQGTLTNTGIKGPASKSFLSSLPTSMTSGDYHGNYDLFNQTESSSPSGDPHKRNLVIHSHSDHTANPDSFYAHPDMSRKTKRMTSVESDYDDPRPPGEEYFQNILPERNCLESSVLNNDPTYGNYNTDSPTGSLSDI